MPTSRNLPPQILNTGFKPVQKTTTVVVGAGCAPPEFSIQVVDDSREIKDRWFIDPNSDYSTGRDGGDTGDTVFPGDGAFGLPGVARTLRALPGLVGSLSRNYIDTKQHRVEVLITDGRFTVNQATGGIGYESTDFGVDEHGEPVTQPEFHASFTWLVEVKRCQ